MRLQKGILWAVFMNRLKGQILSAELTKNIFGYKTMRVWLGLLPQQLQWDIFAAQSWYFGRVSTADHKDQPDSHIKSRIISCFNHQFLFLMASILKYESWSFSSKLLKDKLSFKSLEELVAVFKTTKDGNSQNGYVMEAGQMGSCCEKGHVFI